MFNRCEKLIKIKVINYFNINKVIDIAGMFEFCSELESSEFKELVCNDKNEINNND